MQSRAAKHRTALTKCNGLQPKAFKRAHLPLEGIHQESFHHSHHGSLQYSSQAVLEKCSFSIQLEELFFFPCLYVELSNLPAQPAAQIRSLSLADLGEVHTAISMQRLTILILLNLFFLTLQLHFIWLCSKMFNLLCLVSSDCKQSCLPAGD